MNLWISRIIFISILVSSTSVTARNGEGEVVYRADPKSKKIDVKTKTITRAALSELPLTPPLRVFQFWDVADMPIALETSKYLDIQDSLLFVDITISREGNVELLSFCRDIDEALKVELTEQINSWDLTRLSDPKKDLRTLFLIPAPDSPAAFIDCDENWHPSIMGMIKKA